MLIEQVVGTSKIDSVKGCCARLFLVLCVGFFCHSHTLYGVDDLHNGIFKNIETSKHKESKGVQSIQQPQTYYLYVSDFAQSFIEIPTTIATDPSSTIYSTYLAGRAPIYNSNNEKFGTCSASFLCMQNADGIYTDIANFISADNGLIVTWFTPTTLVNLELDSIIHSMVTECMVTATTKVGFNPFYGQTFSLIVSSDDEKIYFQFTRTGTIY